MKALDTTGRDLIVWWYYVRTKTWKSFEEIRREEAIARFRSELGSLGVDTARLTDSQLLDSNPGMVIIKAVPATDR